MNIFDVQSLLALSLNVVRTALLHQAVQNEERKYHIHIVLDLENH